MKLSIADQKKYPKSTLYLKNDLPKVINIPTIVQAMFKTGQLSKSKFKMALNWNASPTIRINSIMTACGRFKPSKGNSTIEIHKNIFERFEKGKGYLITKTGAKVQALGLNVLHEMVHWADNIDGIDQYGPDEGDWFEKIVYGKNLGC